jgi:hypothetical protein
MPKGSCLCGAISFEFNGASHAPDACHCSQCRKQSGHYWASMNVPPSALKLRGADNIRWFQSSAKVRRGFCGTCGSVLFWEPTDRDDFIAVAMGALDAPTGVKLSKHIFVADKGDYYEIADGLPQHPQY